MSLFLQNKNPAVFALINKLQWMLDKRMLYKRWRSISQTNVIHLSHAKDRANNELFLLQYQQLVGLVSSYFFNQWAPSYQDFHALKDQIQGLQAATTDPAFCNYANGILIEAIDELPVEEAYIATQKLQSEIDLEQQEPLQQQRPVPIKFHKKLAQLQEKLELKFREKHTPWNTPTPRCGG